LADSTITYTEVELAQVNMDAAMYSKPLMINLMDYVIKRGSGGVFTSVVLADEGLQGPVLYVTSNDTSGTSIEFYSKR